MNKTRLLTTLTAAITAVTCSNAAIIIDFDTGYTLGALNGQPAAEASKWSGSGIYQVVEGGFSGNGLQFVNPTNFADINYTPTAAELGGSNAAIGQFNYSFMVRRDGVANASQSFGDVYRIYLTNGRFGAGITFSDVGRINASGAANIMTLAQGQWYEISGVLDFDTPTPTYSVAIDGVVQRTGLTFTKGADFGSIAFRSASGSPEDFIGYTFDNIQITPVPEPAQVGAITGLAVLIGMAVKRLRKAMT